MESLHCFFYFYSMKKHLFVCTANKDRSKTAEEYFSKLHPTCTFKSAGISSELCNQVSSTYITQALIDWAERILVMELIHFNYLHSQFQLNGKHIHILNIPDIYLHGNQELKALLLLNCQGIISCS